MKGGRKMTMCAMYLLTCGVLCGLLIGKVQPATDLTALGICFGGLCGAMAAGVGTIVWGNVQEHKVNGNDRPQQG